VDSLFSASAITHPLWWSLLLGSCKDVCDRFWRGLEVALRNAKQGEESNYGVGICGNSLDSDAYTHVLIMAGTNDLVSLNSF
jgi:hypothetical protein